MLGPEMHRRRETQVQMVRQPQVGQYTYGESGIPAVGIADDGLLFYGAVL